MNNFKADKERLVHDFVELTSIDSVSFHEREAADILLKKTSELGIKLEEDDAGSVYGSDTGNLYGRFSGNGDPILLSAHMDTVEPGIGKQSSIDKDGIIRSNGKTVLGADDIAGVVSILEAIRLVKASGKPHRDVELLFTIAEEPYTRGAHAFDLNRIESKDAYVIDLSGPVGTASNEAPSIVSFECTVTGKASHSGFDPEHGINAVAAAAKAVSRIKQGRPEPDLTLNIGTISGGTMANIVSEKCIITGEARGTNHQKVLDAVADVKKIFDEEAAAIGASAEFSQEVKIMAYKTPEDASVCRRFKSVCDELGYTGELTTTYGGSDNNVFAQHDIQGLVVGCGMYNTHTNKEYIDSEDLVRTAELLAEIIMAD